MMDAGGAPPLPSDDAVMIVENEAEPVQQENPDVRPPATVDFLDTCPVCQLNYHSREAKLLPCLHSFCKKCLPSPSRNLAMPDTNGSQVDGATKPLNVIRCPVCRQECMEVDVMDNFFVRDSAEAPSSTVERPVQLCMSCDDNTETTGFCVDCVEFMCGTCVEAHQRVKFTKDHTIRQKEDMSQETAGIFTQRPVFCDIHKQEPLKLFCETCDLPTCRDCQLLKHKDHNYQFLEDAYLNHKQHMEDMTRQLLEKKKIIEDVTISINNGLLQVDENRISVHNDIKKSICSLILEINRKGKILVNQLEGLTKDHESGLKKQKEDIGYLSRHLDHVINFTKWATARSGGTALLYCKRLILFQIGNLLRAKCNTSFIPQSTVRFQCRSAFWASNFDLGSLVVENVPGHQLGGFQGIPHQLPHPVPGPPGSPGSQAPGHPQPRLGPHNHNTLAQLQMQVEKLAQQPHWQPQPQPPPWAWYQSMRLQRPPPGPLQNSSPSGPPGLLSMHQQGRRFITPPANHLSPTSTLPSPGYPPQAVQSLRGLVSSSSYSLKHMDVFKPTPHYSHNAPLPSNGSFDSPHSRLHQMESAYQNKHPGGPIQIIRPNYPQTLPASLPFRAAQGQYHTGLIAISCEEKPGTVSWKPPETQKQANGSGGSAAKRRRRSSPGPIIVIKDEPEDDISCGNLQGNLRPNLPDSTGVQAQTCQQDGGEKQAPPHRKEKQAQTPAEALGPPVDPSPVQTPRQDPVLPEKRPGRGPDPEDPNEDWCSVCQNGGELLCCGKCPKVFHLSCHVPSLLKLPSGEWFCSFCRDLSVPEVVYDCDIGGPEPRSVKKEREPEGGLSPVDKRKCERLLLKMYCSRLSADFREARPPLISPENQETTAMPTNLSTVKSKLESKLSPVYCTPAEFVSDVRLIFQNCAVFNKTDTEVATAGRSLESFFEEQLKGLFPQWTTPEVKSEVISSVTPPISPPHPAASDEESSQHAKSQRMCSEAHGDCSRTPAPLSSPKGEEPSKCTGASVP
ncbi:hypothetical protein DPEC_G00217160 [Dallia pectoralis]|uniref:Uncharacterized protein n=1 Tax=Dallia pectoralis TaxID=75939 RepID=A0ACC2G2U3_DALPE|nr:hypothetical protein DPEC_G00217160 [Dallia pectoralis]